MITAEKPELSAGEKDVEGNHELPVQQNHAGVHGHELSNMIPEDAITEKEKKHVLRKIDMLLLPLASGCVLRTYPILLTQSKCLIKHCSIMQVLWTCKRIWA